MSIAINAFCTSSICHSKNKIFGITQYQNTMAAKDLSEFGVAVVPVMDASSRSWWEEAVWTAMDEFPEYKVKGKTAQRVLGGFGAFGNPSSYHHPVVRSLRSKIKRLAVKPVLKEYAEDVIGQTDDVNLESLFDRLCVRYEPFLRPGAELWHRDIYDAKEFKLRSLPRSLPDGRDDIIIGGWLNLDHREQHFVALVASHDEPFSGAKGFAKFSEAEIARFRFNERLQGQASRFFGNTLRTNTNGEIIVPPGHLILFVQRIIHSVKSGQQPDTPALRFFHGFRLTGEEIPLIPHNDVIENGGVPRIPSGQIPPMFSKNHYAAFAKATGARWREWGANTFKDVCLFERSSSGYVYKTPGSKNNRNVFANKNRAMPSLSEMGLMSEEFAYSDADKAIVSPQPL